ncbi:PAS domain S-box protein [Halorarum halophilum]|uniref:histidine kinase n=1 Tax=Halorarum halophilum TaxID=2743090 RepID=A0A7D5KMX4_9EURY|nr:histidine kinase N-terminal 7TM domain-containing protein [Halobaculum halophilum]QLG28775.1 PAS domain S-box protein [Halobaculum halophilum]
MVWQVTWATVALAIAATVSTGVLAHVLPAAQDNWRRLEYRAFVWLSLGAIVWTATYATHLAATTGSAKYVLLDLTWVGIAIVTASWPVFAFSVTGSDVLTGWSILVLVAVPTVVAALALTNPVHGLVYADVVESDVAAGGFEFTPGPALVAFLAYSFAVNVATFVHLLRATLGAAGDARVRFALVCLAGVIPTAGGIAGAVASGGSPTVDYTPVCLALTSSMTGLAVTRYGLLDPVPVARETVVARMRDPVVVVGEDGRVLDSNDAADDRLGVGDDDLNRPASAVFADVPGVERALAGDECDRIELVGPDGDVRLFDVSVTALGTSEPTAGSGVRSENRVLVFRDVTDQRRIERRFEALIEGTSALIAVLDSEGTVTYASPAHEDVLGYDPDSLVGRSVFEFVHTEDREDMAGAFAEVTRDGESRTVQCRFRCADGSWRELSATGDDLLDDPFVEGVVVSSTDITVQKQAERRLQVLNRVLRHDLRNDMNVVDGYAGLLATTVREDPDRACEYADIIRQRARNLVDLGEKARTLDALVTDAETVTEVVDVVALIRSHCEQLRAEHPEVELTASLPESASVTAVPILGSAFDNLLENAVEHNDRERPTVDVSATVVRPSDTEEAAHVRVRIGDDGPPIPENDREVLRRGSETALEHASGLGLWLVSWIVSASGGTIEFDPVEPRGNVVTVRLPLYRPDGDAEAADDDKATTHATNDAGAGDVLGPSTDPTGE